MIKYKRLISILVIIAVIAIIVLAAGLITSKEKTSEISNDQDIVNNVNIIGFSEELFLEDPEAQDGYQITTDVEPFPTSVFSTKIIELIKEDWGNAEDSIYTSSLPGMCDEQFDTWADAEDFIGLEIDNPLATCGWLLPADAGTGLALDEEVLYEFTYPERHHCEAIFYGNKQGALEFVQLGAGYQLDDLRITMNATCYGENAEASAYGVSSIWAEEVDFEVYEATLANGGNAVVVLEPDLGDYTSADIYLAKNNVFYRMRVVGDVNEELAVRNTAEELLELFGGEVIIPVAEDLLINGHIDITTLPVLDMDVPDKEVFEDRVFIMSDNVDNELEELVYRWYLYEMLPDYEGQFSLIKENEALKTAIKNSEKAFYEGQYYAEIMIHELNTYAVPDLEKVNDYAMEEIASAIAKYQVTEWAIVEADLTWVYSAIWRAAAPQLEEGRYQRCFLVGRTNENDDWKIYDIYWGEYVGV